MSGAVLLDTGPLVSFLADESDHAAWVQGEWDRMPPPMLTCEAVLTEAAFLLKREGVDPDALFELLQRKVIRLALRMDEEQADLRRLRHPDPPPKSRDAWRLTGKSGEPLWSRAECPDHRWRGRSARSLSSTGLIPFPRGSGCLRLMRRYRDRPMSLADACLVRLSEMHQNCTVFTLDSDFRICRRHGNKVIPVLMPEIGESPVTRCGSNG